jgi:predicted ATPase
MSELKSYLEKVRIRNFLSLREVELPLKPLTILVGPNSSGKSNILAALGLLKDMMTNEEPPPVDVIEDRIWAGGADSIQLEFEAKIEGRTACYSVELRPEADNQIFREALIINGVRVISVEAGKGQVRDEDDVHEIDYHSKKLALRSAGDYGEKPVTRHLTEFIRDWRFYDINPREIRRGRIDLLLAGRVANLIPGSPSVHLSKSGANLHYLLTEWYENDRTRFQAVNRAFKDCIKFEIGKHIEDDETAELSFSEGYPSPIPLHMVSEGTLRLLAYQILINQPGLPPLITIEEPERNFHPAWLNTLSDLLGQLSKRSQVIIATHSSQLLDTFAPQSLSENLGVLLLKNIPGSGTEVVPLDKVQEDREGLKSWINEFGIGSAIFDSELLQDVMEVEPCL